MTQPSITCPRCGATSYHPEDIRYGYCGACDWWTSDPQLAPYYDKVYPPKPDPPKATFWRRVRLLVARKTQT